MYLTGWDNTVIGFGSNLETNDRALFQSNTGDQENLTYSLYQNDNESVFDFDNGNELTGNSFMLTALAEYTSFDPNDNFGITGTAEFYVSKINFVINESDITPPHCSEVPVPAAAWLFGSALLGLGFKKRQ